MLIDLHNHLKGWSPDADQSLTELLNSATKKHIDGVAVTDHYDIGSVTAPDVKWVFDIEKYLRFLAKHRKRFPAKQGDGSPGLLIGIELGYNEKYLDQINKITKDQRFDFSILSLHTFHGIDPVRDKEHLLPLVKCGRFYNKLIELIAESALNAPDANIIGHYDFFSRYIPVKKSKILYSDAPLEFDRLFSIMIYNGQALEINTSTIENMHLQHGYDFEDAMPDARIISRYIEMGGKSITIGSDAHCSKDDGRYIKETAVWLRQQGVNEICWFENHKALYGKL